MLKKRKHKMKRRNTEPHMQLPLVAAASASGGQVPNSAPPPTVSYSTRKPNLVDLCDSPTHATPV